MLDLNAIAAAAGQANDQTQVNQGGGKKERQLPAEGVGYAVLHSYVETGTHYNATYNKTTRGLKLTFELNHPNHLIEFDGKKEPQLMTISVNISDSEKGKFVPLFRLLNHDNRATHLSQLIGQKYLVTVRHNVGKDGKTYANLDDINGNYTFKPPFMEQLDPATGQIMRQDISQHIPNLAGTPKLFIWELNGITDEQYLEMWNSLYIENSNWLQEVIKTNSSFERSRLASLLNGVNTEQLDNVLGNVEQQPSEY